MPDDKATELFDALEQKAGHSGCIDVKDVAYAGYRELLEALEAYACAGGNDPDLPCCVARKALADARAALLEALNATTD